MMRIRIALLLLASIVLAPGRAEPQVTFGADVAHDRATWHFDNPSSIDTDDLVPHFFEQQYTLDNAWFGASAAYRAGAQWRTTFAATPMTQATATDYDTFFDSGGVTWVSGTTGDARMHSLRIGQEVKLGTVGHVGVSGGYRLRLDFANFLEGDKTVTRNGVLVSQSIVTTREYTRAQTHEIFVSATASTESTALWQVRVRGDLSPASMNRLAIELPDKYPGQTLIYRTTNLMTSGRLDVIRGTGRWPLVFTVLGDRSWNYNDTQWVRRSSIGAGVSVGASWR
jgi:hypothetical protein